ncbi:MAG: hypothetical protein R3E39_12310 [Anaerolineae bacterium]
MDITEDYEISTTGGKSGNSEGQFVPVVQFMAAMSSSSSLKRGFATTTQGKFKPKGIASLIGNGVRVVNVGQINFDILFAAAEERSAAALFAAKGLVFNTGIETHITLVISILEQMYKYVSP